MTDVEIAVSLVALLGGLLLANVANNLADALRARRDLPIGFVPWAINFYISAAVINTFVLFSEADETLSYDIIQLTTLFVGLMAYIMVSRLLYPQHEERWASVEDYYIANRKLILGLTLIAPAIAVVGVARTDFGISPSEQIFGILVSFGPVIVALALLMLTEKRQWHRAGWGFLIAHRISIMTWVAVAN